jgi:hypothetical protein
VFFVALMARAVERIGDNAVDIARQAAFVTTGELPPIPEPRDVPDGLAAPYPPPRDAADESPVAQTVVRVARAARRSLLRIRGDGHRRLRSAPVERVGPDASPATRCAAPPR